MNHPHFLSCDWGTTSFRIRLIDTATNKSVAKVSSDRGNAPVYSKWKAKPDTNRLHFYLRYIKEAVDEIAAMEALPLESVPILISGMASSSIGMKELPYADVPFGINGETAYAEWIDGMPVLPNKILLISGLQQDNDVMRGEETQLLGLISLLNLNANEDSIFILPGTHSKHIHVANNQVYSFNTFMTGEIFEILKKHSILSHAVEEPEDIVLTDEEKAAFKEGVTKALESELLNSLFSVRIKQLKNQLSAHHNYFYLSGLLIGSEIKYITRNGKQKLMLCSSGNLNDLYQMAFDCAALSEQTVTIAPETLDESATAGQRIIYSHMISKGE